MLRLYLPSLRPGDLHAHITGAELRHVRTLRLAAGARVRIIDDSGGEHDVVLERVSAREAVGRVVASAHPVRESPLELVLAPALLKGPKMDLVVEKATELGVQRLAPVLSARVVGLGVHRERWQRIAVSAAKQSGRTRVPRIDAPAPLDVVVAAPWPGLRVVPWEEEHAVRLDRLPAEASAVVALIGPEGGLTADEIALAGAHGFVALTLGPRILRAETAAIAVAAHCQRRWGDG